MAKIHFIDHSGEKRSIDIENGATVMEGAIRNAIPGIEAECGGACACATCHVLIDPAYLDRLPAPAAEEEDMLDLVPDATRTSRLACQIVLTPDLAGCTVRIP